MPHLFDPESWNERPAMRAFVLAWAAAAAQTPIAAWAWLSCFALGLAASRWPTRADMPNIPMPSALHELSPGSDTPRRTDVTRPRAVVPRRSSALAKVAPDLEPGFSTMAELCAGAEAWSAELAHQGHAVCVLQLALHDLDGFAQRYGNDAGQQLRMQVTKRLRQLTRSEDRLVQLGDDHYALLVACPADDAATLARSLATRLVHEIQRPATYLTLSNLHVGCSVGSAIWHVANEAISDAMEHAASALALAKRSGHGQTRQYSALRIVSQT